MFHVEQAHASILESQAPGVVGTFNELNAHDSEEQYCGMKTTMARATSALLEAEGDVVICVVSFLARAWD